MNKIFNFDKIFYILYSSLFLFTPLIMISITSELFEFNKMIFIYIITTLIIFFWVAKMICFKKIIIKKTPFDIPIILFLTFQVASTIFSIDRHTSIFGYYGRFNGGLLSIIAYTILFYGFVSNFQWNKVVSLLKISLISSFLVILWGLPGKVGHDMSCLLFMGQFNNSCWTDQFRPAERMFSTLGQPNWLGAYLAINFFIGLYFLLNDKKRIIYGSYLFVNFASIIFTRSRSAFISIIIGLGILVLFFLYKRFKKLFVISVIILFFTLFLFIVVAKNRIINYLTLTKDTSPVTESFDIRKIVWKGAVDLGLKYPVFGTGVETFAYSYYFVRPWQHNLTSEWDYLYNKAHNEYLNYLATTGFVGLGSYLIMIGAVIFVGIKQISNIFLLAYLSILITNFFGFSTTTVNLFFYLIPAFLIVSSNRAIEQSSNKLSLSQKITIFFLLLSTFYLLFSILRYWHADTLYAKADQYAKGGNYQLSANLLNQALQLKYEHVYEDKLSYMLANLAVLASYQKQPEVAKKLITASQFYNQKSLDSSPKNILYWKTKAKNYYLFYQITLNKNDVEVGINTLNQAKIISPTDPKIPYSLAIFYSLMFDETKDKEKKSNFQNLSLKMVNQTINLKPDYRDGYFLKGQLLKKYGKKDEAKKIFQFILEKISPEDAEVKNEL